MWQLGHVLRCIDGDRGPFLVTLMDLALVYPPATPLQALKMGCRAGDGLQMSRFYFSLFHPCYKLTWRSQGDLNITQ